MVMLSKYLRSVVRDDSKLQLIFWSEDKVFGIPWYWHGVGIITISFDPWNGSELRCVYDYEKLKDYKENMRLEKELYKERGQECDLYNYNLIKKYCDKFLSKFGPVVSKKSRKYWDFTLQTLRKGHSIFTACKELESFLKGGEDEGMTSIIHIPNIRTYAILNKKEYGGFEPMDYCPFCGAKFPKRLDDKLTEILQKEYGLESWKDYKKAPHEFHTDEWWKKRGL